MFTQQYLTSEITRCRWGVFLSCALASANTGALGLSLWAVSQKAYYPAVVIVPICIMIARANLTGFMLMFRTLKKLHMEQARLLTSPQRVHAPRVAASYFGETSKH